MEDLTDSIKAGKQNWQNFYKKQILKENVVLETDTTEQPDPEYIEDLDRAIEKKKTEYNNTKIQFNASKADFSGVIQQSIKISGKSIGKEHYPFTTYDKAITIYSLPTEASKDKQLGSQGTFDHELFLNDFKKKAREQGLLGRAPNDTTPYVVYNQPHLQRAVNDAMFPIVMVLYSGPNNESKLNSEIFEDPIVKSFKRTKDLHSLGRSQMKEIEKLADARTKALKTQMPAQKPKDGEETGDTTEPGDATGTGPGKVMNESHLIPEGQKISDADVTNGRRKLLAEGWKAYAAKHKDDKNNENPDKFTLIVG